MEEDERNSILRKLKINQEAFDFLGLSWDELEKIYKSHEKHIPELEKVGIFIANQLMSQRNVHSVRFRVKDSRGLIIKIIRKRIAYPKRVIDLKNYRDEVTDLIGVRAIHLMKNHWTGIDKIIVGIWNLKEAKKAYIRGGDSKEIIDNFAKSGFEVKEHPFGYRSLHYIIITKPGKEEVYAEIQVRTIFEEGWSEIDHRVRYPHETENELFGEFLSIFNRIAGSADEMGSFIMNLKMDQAEKRIEFNDEIREKDRQIKELEAKIDKLDIDKSEKQDLFKMIKGIDLTNYKPLAESAFGLAKLTDFTDFTKNVNQVYAKGPLTEGYKKHQRRLRKGNDEETN